MVDLAIDVGKMQDAASWIETWNGIWSILEHFGTFWNGIILQCPVKFKGVPVGSVGLWKRWIESKDFLCSVFQEQFPSLKVAEFFICISFPPIALCSFVQLVLVVLLVGGGRIIVRSNLAFCTHLGIFSAITYS